MRLLAPLAALGLVVAGAPVPASAAGCTGVTVVVDFASLGGGVRTGCAAGDPGSGLAALSGAGFGYDLATRQPGFVCRINGAPQSDPCVNAAPTTAYWSYWHGTPGGSWTYSSSGAAGHDPAPGSVEGWAFGAAAQPGIAPPAPPPPPRQEPPPATAQPVPPAARPVPPGSPATTGAGGQPTTATATTTESAAPESGTAGASTTTSSGTGSSGTASVAPSTAPSDVSMAPAAGETPDEDGGAPVGFIVGITVIAALAGAGVWVARRRAAS